MQAASQSLRKQAAKWFLRMRGAEPDHPQRGEFERWLLQHPRHAEEYHKVAEVWDDFDSTPKLESLAQAVLQQKLEQDIQRKKLAGRVVKASLVLVMGFFSLFGYQSWRNWQAQPVMQLAQESHIGQIISQQLPDGSTLTLSPNSALEVSYYRHQRIITLKHGEAIFEVSKDPQRPFIVNADSARITVLGTRFLVNRLDERVLVAVDHGHVQVESLTPAGQVLASPIYLTNDKMGEVRANQPATALSGHARDAFAFTQGKLIFDNAPLSEVAQTLSRYRHKPVLAVTSAKQQQAHISAVIKIAEMENFLAILPQMSHVRVVDNAQATQLISK
jgi:transmembrane sensor